MSRKYSSAMSRRGFLKLTGATAAAAALYGLGLPPLALADQIENSGVEYRAIPRSGLKVSTVGIGAGMFTQNSEREIREIMALALDHGLNFIDMPLPHDEGSPGKIVAEAVASRRDKIVTQIHLGALHRHGQYVRSRNLDLIRQNTETTLASYQGYSDIALIHYVDSQDDFERIMNDGLFDYARRLKQDGQVRHLGFSSHSPDICRRFMETGAFDLYMLSVNPAYDFSYANGRLVLSQDRAALIQETARQGLGFIAMKTYGGGRLLDDRTSSFGRAMSPAQCIQYALDRPAVLSCPVGLTGADEVGAAVGYYSTGRAERDYSFIGDLNQADMDGHCVYCNHCLPCPANIDIGAAVKYYDLALRGDELARDHYRRLLHTAADCIYCGVCEKNCPFGVPIMEVMKQMTAFFA